MKVSLTVSTALLALCLPLTGHAKDGDSSVAAARIEIVTYADLAVQVVNLQKLGKSVSQSGNEPSVSLMQIADKGGDEFHLPISVIHGGGSGGCHGAQVTISTDN